MPRVQKRASKRDAQLDKLSIDELNARLQQYLEKPWVRFERAVKDKITPLLYYLRKKLHHPGNHHLGGWAAWVDENLNIARRTCDLWTSQYAKKHRLPLFQDTGATSSKIARGRRSELRDDETPDGKVQITANWLGTPKEQRQFNAAWEALGDHAGPVAFKAITKAAAKVHPGKKKPSQSTRIERTHKAVRR